MSVKNNIAILVSHIWREYKIIVKTIHYTMNILSIEAKIFTIRCRISWTSQIQGITCIVVITGVTHTTKHIFNISIYSYQLHIIIISNNLRNFFNKNTSNSISLWNYPSNNKWPLYLLVNKKSKFHKMSLILPSKMSWKFSKKEKCNSIIRK